MILIRSGVRFFCGILYSYYFSLNVIPLLSSRMNYMLYLRFTFLFLQNFIIAATNNMIQFKITHFIKKHNEHFRIFGKKILTDLDNYINE